MRTMTDPAGRPHPWAIARATYTRPAYRSALIILWAMMLIALAGLVMGYPLITLFFVIPAVGGNLALSRRVQRDLTQELSG